MNNRITEFFEKMTGTEKPSKRGAKSKERVPGMPWVICPDNGEVLDAMLELFQKMKEKCGEMHPNFRYLFIFEFPEWFSGEFTDEQIAEHEDDDSFFGPEREDLAPGRKCLLIWKKDEYKGIKSYPGSIFEMEDGLYPEYMKKIAWSDRDIQKAADMELSFAFFEAGFEGVRKVLSKLTAEQFEKEFQVVDMLK